ncbi:MAG: ABC transporter permease [Acidimicrobiales bacterium]|nr:ABC transporter permease [Acidimicrobiales bacterium]
MSAIGEAWSYVTTGANWTGDDGILVLTWNHLRLSAFATVSAAVVAVPAGVLIGHRRRGGALAASVVNIGRALPSFAVLVLAFGVFSQWGRGLTIWPTYVALVLLAIPPMFTNTLTGVQEVPAEVREAATGMGMRARQLLWRVETPVALPLILTGLRVSAVQVVATATLGAWVGYQCLGTLIYEGFAQQDDAKILTGATLVALLTILVDTAFSFLERAVTPWTRPQRGRAARPTVRELEPDRPAPATG